MLRVFVLAVFLALFALACSSDDGGEPTSEATSTTAVPSATPAQASERTGIPEIDDALDVLFSGDEAAVEALVAYTPLACVTEPMGVGSPPVCRPNEADESLVDVFIQAQCEGYYTRPEEMDIAIETLTAPGPNLRAVFPFGGDYWPPTGEYVAIYEGVVVDRPADLVFSVILNSDGRIVGILWGCGQTYEAFVDFFGLTDALYFADAPPGLTGIHDLDVVLDAINKHNPDALRSFIVFQGVSCITTPEGIGAPPLCRDEPLGSSVAVLPVQGCEFMWVYQDESDWVRDQIATGSLYAVYEDDDTYKAALRHATPDDDLGFMVTIDERAITEVNLGCGMKYQDALDGVPEEDIVLGPLEAIPQPGS